MKRLFTLLLAAFSVFAAQAQQNDPNAKKILDAVSAKFKSFKAPKASFSYKIENSSGKVLSTKKGTLAMKGVKYHISMPGMEIFSDGKQNWNYDKSANEVTVKDVENATGEITPQKLFTNFYDKDFLYKLNGETKKDGKTLEEIELTPTNKTRPYHKVYLWIDKATKVFHSASILEKSGNRYTYTVSSFKADGGTGDSEFTFNKAKYPGVEVVDLR